MANKLRNGVAKVEKALPGLPAPIRVPGGWLVTGAKWALGSVVGVDSDDPVVGLTFDDGPDPSETGRILDVLVKRGAHASFFLLAERAEAHPDLVHRIITEGHEAALHGANHDNLTKLGMGDVVSRVRGGKRRLEKVVGSPVKLFRPPYGAQSLRTYLVARLSGLAVVVWTSWANDWEEREAAEIADLAMKKMRPGGILLLHDGFEPNPEHSSIRPTFDRTEVVNLILDRLEEAGLRAETVSGLLATRPPLRRLWFET